MNKIIKQMYDATKIMGYKAPLAPEEMPLGWRKIFHKNYPRFPKVDLRTEDMEDKDIETLLYERGSVRDFSDTPVSFSKLSKILEASMLSRRFGNEIENRPYPSAGARFPIEPYVASFNVEGLEEGVYHYDMINNQLEKLFGGSLSKYARAINSNVADTSVGASIILTSVIPRTEIKYGTSAYRFSLLEAGHIGQNIYLMAGKTGLGCCAIGGSDNDKVSELLDLTDQEIPLYVIALGNPRKNSQ